MTPGLCSISLPESSDVENCKSGSAEERLECSFKPAFEKAG